MGIFSQNRTMLGDDFEIMANESYQGAAGAYRAMTEGFQNSYAVFESCIGLDFMEAAVVNESVSAEDFEVVQESFVGDFFNKIKEFLTKLIEKIKGIVKSFITKVTGTFCRDGKTLVNKYKNDVLKKDLSKMKYKWAKNTGKTASLNTSNLTGTFDSIMIDIDKDNIDKEIESGRTIIAVSDSVKDKINDNEYLENDLGSMCGSSSCTLGEFAKEFHEYLFDDEEECEGFGSDGASITDIMSELTNGKNAINDMEKNRKKQEDETKKLIKSVENAQKKALAKVTAKDNKQANTATAINAKLNVAMTVANQISTVQTKFFACLIDEKKKKLARCKKVFVQAAAYRPKSTNEDVEYLYALGEAAEYEVCEMFDAISA